LQEKSEAGGCVNFVKGVPPYSIGDVDWWGFSEGCNEGLGAKCISHTIPFLIAFSEGGGRVWHGKELAALREGTG